GVEEFDRAPRLVRLQSPDQMPLDFVFGADGAEFSDFGRGLLDAVFADSADARFNSLADSRRRNGLAGGDERDFGNLTPGAPAGRRDPPIDCFQPRPQILRLSGIIFYLLGRRNRSAACLRARYRASGIIFYLCPRRNSDGAE